MINQKLTQNLYLLAEYMEIDEVAFKPRAYERAAQSLDHLPEDIEQIYKEGGLKALTNLPDVGQGIAQKIEEFISTGKIKELELYKKKFPVDVASLTKIEGIGPRSIKELYERLGIKTLQDLEREARAHNIQNIPGFGKKSEEGIISAIKFAKHDQGRFALGFVLPQIEELVADLKRSKKFKDIIIAGSVRRMKETIGDVDLLAIAKNSKEAVDRFCSLPQVQKIKAKGKTKVNVLLDSDIEVDLRVVPEESFGSAIQYFTGSKKHNVKLRQIAKKSGYKLNEYGLYKGQKQIAGQTEKEVYQKLGLAFVAPEMREDTGEIELAQKGKLPKLVDYKDVKGDLQMHSTWSDGAYSIEEMARVAKKLGRQYILITDHAGRLEIAGGLKEDDLARQAKEIETADKKVAGIKILKGAEVDIDKNGQLHIKDSALKKLDIVLGSIHSSFKMNKEEMTKRVCRAMENPYMNIWAHPSGRLLQRRKGYEVDWEEIFKTAVKTNTAIEINAYPLRLDLTWENVKKAVAMGVNLTIGTDSHSADHLKYLRLGVGVARRGWATKKDILNCLGWQDLLKHFGKNK